MRPASHARVPSADIAALHLHEYFSPLSTGLGGKSRYRPDEPQISEDAEQIEFSQASGKRFKVPPSSECYTFSNINLNMLILFTLLILFRQKLRGCLKKH